MSPTRRLRNVTVTLEEDVAQWARIEAARRDTSVSKLLGQLLLFGLASPFLELQNPGSGLLGLVILFVGLSIAFRMTAAKPLEVDGPYSVTA